MIIRILNHIYLSNMLGENSKFNKHKSLVAFFLILSKETKYTHPLMLIYLLPSNDILSFFLNVYIF